MPVSCTETRKVKSFAVSGSKGPSSVSSGEQVMVTEPPAGVNFSELLERFTTAREG